eukprot:CAMPEP_0117450392 /NCGR_PEP_ID=MMETSP0759-20121206/8444_1 /TAXON_ID=63605 /ORGANISM="Percolomonas cosmopolitus, Strain WS" /LENGTH=236 /DNA_ID=CAMNT_0005242911 /DNA_START=195 /DNA_END=905 /DNA_ORIENTATION=+
MASSMRRIAKFDTMRYRAMTQALQHKNGTKHMYNIISTCSSGSKQYEDLFSSAKEDSANSNNEFFELIQRQNPISKFQTIQGDLMFLYLMDQYLYASMGGEKAWLGHEQIRALLNSQDSWTEFIQFDSLRSEARLAAGRWEEYILGIPVHDLRKVTQFISMSKISGGQETHVEGPLLSILMDEFNNMKKLRLIVADTLTHFGYEKTFDRDPLSKIDDHTRAEVDRIMNRSDVKWAL